MTAALPARSSRVPTPRSPLARACRALADVVWPPRCLVCQVPDAEADPLCRPCLARLPEPRERCARCGRPTGPHGARSPCARCTGDETRLSGVVAAWPYSGVARDLVVALKFRGRARAATVMGEALVEALREAAVPGDLIVPMPLAPRRRRARGYNQALLIARAVARALELELAPGALAIRRAGPPQATLTGAARRRAPRGRFKASARRVRGRTVLLVDDVLTTGATAEAAAVALEHRGALAVTAAVICRS